MSIASYRPIYHWGQRSVQHSLSRAMMGIQGTDMRFTRRQFRQGSGGGTGDDHVDEVLGSSEFFVYLTPNKQAKGYQGLKDYLEAMGCQVLYPADSEHRPPGLRYDGVKITNRGEVIPPAGLKRAHRWAHQRNFLHTFFRPV